MREFYRNVAGHAQRASEALGIFPSVILGQWGLETGHGTSWLVPENNLGGIKYVGQSQASGYVTRESDNAKFATYKTVNDFVDDYIRVLSINGYGYPEVRKATTVEAQAEALGESGYCAGDSDYGEKILRIIKNQGLRKFDRQEADQGGRGEEVRFPGSTVEETPENISFVVSKDQGKTIAVITVIVSALLLLLSPGKREA